VTADLDAQSMKLLRRGQLLEVATLVWNVVGIIVLAIAALRAHSVALAWAAVVLHDRCTSRPPTLASSGANFTARFKPRSSSRRAMAFHRAGIIGGDYERSRCTNRCLP
jgi:hypothetical protein